MDYQEQLSRIEAYLTSLFPGFSIRPDVAFKPSQFLFHLVSSDDQLWRTVRVTEDFLGSYAADQVVQQLKAWDLKQAIRSTLGTNEIVVRMSGIEVHS